MSASKPLIRQGRARTEAERTGVREHRKRSDTAVLSADRGPRPKPMAQARRVSLFHRQVQVDLSSAAVDILFGQAKVLSEGQLDEDRFYGSTMVTIDCTKAAQWVSDPCDSTTIRQLSELCVYNDLFRARARHLGETEARRIALGQRAHICDVQIELHVHTSEHNLHVDIDVEATPVQRNAI